MPDPTPQLPSIVEHFPTIFAIVALMLVLVGAGAHVTGAPDSVVVSALLGAAILIALLYFMPVLLG